MPSTSQFHLPPEQQSPWARWLIRRRKHVRARPVPRALRPTAARRVLAASTALPVLMALSAAVLPQGHVANVIGSSCIPVGLVVWYLLRAATQWQFDSPWDLDEREADDRRSSFEYAWMWTGAVPAVLALFPLLGQIGVLAAIEPSRWVTILAAMAWTNLLLPNAVATWRPYVPTEA